MHHPLDLAVGDAVAVDAARRDDEAPAHAHLKGYGDRGGAASVDPEWDVGRGAARGGDGPRDLVRRRVDAEVEVERLRACLDLRTCRLGDQRAVVPRKGTGKRAAAELQRLTDEEHGTGR